MKTADEMLQWLDSILEGIDRSSDTLAVSEVIRIIKDIANWLDALANDSDALVNPHFALDLLCELSLTIHTQLRKDIDAGNINDDPEFECFLDSAEYLRDQKLGRIEV